MSSERHILILRFSALGDVAMTLPAVYAAARQNPDVKFTMVTRPFFARLFINPPANLSLLPINPADYKGTAGTMRLVKRLLQLHPTAVADLHNVLRTWVTDGAFRLRGVKVRMVDKERSGRTEALRSGRKQKNFVDRYCEVFRDLGLKCDADGFTTVFGPEQPATPIEVSHPAVGIAPFARYFNKTYPPEMMRSVVRLLCDAGVNVYLFGARGEEAEQLKKWADDSERCVSLAGQFTIEEELALMARMDVMVSMDSANQHLASLTGTRVITLWGSTTPECGFTPYGQTAEGWIVSRQDCQPCTVAGSKICQRGDFECMRSLTPESVARKIIQFIDN